jgi:phage terminase small subunit
MLTRREVLNELRRIGVKDPALLKKYCDDFEHYMEINNGLKIATRREESEDRLLKLTSRPKA